MKNCSFEIIQQFIFIQCSNIYKEGVDRNSSHCFKIAQSEIHVIIIFFTREKLVLKGSSDIVLISFGHLSPSVEDGQPFLRKKEMLNIVLKTNTIVTSLS
jgi:hypothetical protein